MKAEEKDVKEILSSVNEVMSPIVEEIEGNGEVAVLKEENDYLDKIHNDTRRSDELDVKYQKKSTKTNGEAYENNYKKKIEMRCDEQLTRGSQRCR